MPAQVRIEADQASFRRVAHAVADEADGRKLRADLVRELQQVAGPVVQQIRAALYGMPTGGTPHAGMPLRAAVAAGIGSEIVLRGRSAGVRVVASNRGMPRNFRHAPKRLNSTRWRHQVFGRDVWVTQIGEPGYFDRTASQVHTRARAGVRQAMQDSVDRIARKA